VAERKKVVIIGGGPAGIATAIQLMRYNVHPFVVEKDEIGGLLRNANLVENYPGFPDGIRGVDLVDLFAEQLVHSGAVLVEDEVVELERGNDGFFLECRDHSFQTDIVVIASGTEPKKVSGLEIPDEVRSRVLYEVYPMRETKDVKIVVVGAGDAAYDYAVGLGEANEVVILRRDARQKCLPVLRERVERADNVEVVTGAVRAVTAKEGGLSIEYATGSGNGVSTIESDYLLIAVGREPSLGFLGEDLIRDLGLVTQNGQVHLVGDVKNGSFRQVGISVGDGLKAAMQISQDIRTGVV
jgi:thioredoxin reductase